MTSGILSVLRGKTRPAKSMGSLSMQKEVDRPTRLLQFVAFVDLPFSFRSLDLFCSFTLV